MCCHFQIRSATVDFVFIRGIEGKIVSVPLYSIFLKSDLITGQVEVGLRSSLPVKGVSLLLGNDLAGGKVVPSIQLCSQPIVTDDCFDTELFTDFSIGDKSSQNLEVDSKNYSTSKTENLQNTISTFLLTRITFKMHRACL